jgi:hypothetical protein
MADPVTASWELPKMIRANPLEQNHEIEAAFTVYGSIWPDLLDPASRYLEELNRYIGFSEPEMGLLATFMDMAEAIAPFFSQDFIARLSDLPTPFNPSELDNQELEIKLQRWFVNLFSGNMHPQSGELPGGLKLPVFTYISLMGLIIKYGLKVIQGSPQRDQAREAFIKSLACDLAKKQITMQENIEYISSLLLLD